MSTIKRRLTRLEVSRGVSIRPGVFLLAREDLSLDDVRGVLGCGPRFPDDLTREPGESMQAFQDRIEAAITGAGPLALVVVY